ncbi:MAG: histone H1 [Bacteroidota bacterium]
MEKFQKLKQLISDLETDAGKFYNSNNGAAGTRVRKAMQELKVLASDIRKEISEKKNSK